MWYPFKTTARFMQENNIRDMAIKAACAAVDAARTHGTAIDSDLGLLGDDVVRDSYVLCDSSYPKEPLTNAGTFASNLKLCAYKTAVERWARCNPEIFADSVKREIALRLIGRVLEERYR
jgi:hypothetical protein